MTKTIFEEMGGTYRQVGDYLLPNITVPAEEEIEPIGLWGKRHATDGHTVWKDDKQRIIDLHCFEFTDDGIVYEGDIFPSKTFSGIGKVGDITVSCIEPLSQVMLHLGYEHDKNDVHDVMLLCETFQIAIPDEYKEK